ncbi:MAG: ferritin family protein [Acidobacteria bacterium]|nr:ferritin family protein [Acidobacteriota bacterium]
MGITREEAVNMAIQLEEDGIKFYRDIASKTSNELTKKMFESLAEDEVRHIEWIKNVAPDVATSKEFNEATYKRLKGIFSDAPAEVIASAKATEEDVKAIDIAIGMETKSREEYLRYATGNNEPAVQKLFNMLADVEKFHAELLENSKEYLNTPADWFMQEEGWMFDGG